MILPSVQTPRGVIVNVSEQEARDIFLATEDAILAAKKDLLLVLIREKRNRIMRETDWTQVSDSALSPAQTAAWKTYRQALRDLPETATDLAAVDWPVPPDLLQTGKKQSASLPPAAKK